MNMDNTKNIVRHQKNILIYHLDYDFLYNKLKKFENKNYYKTIDLINNVSSFFLLHSFKKQQDPVLNLNCLFSVNCECILNNNKIETELFMKLLYIINFKKKFNINIFNLNDLNISTNKIYNKDVIIEFENKKIIKIDLKNDLLDNLHKSFVLRNMYKLININLTYEFTSEYLINNIDKLEDYYSNLYKQYIKIYLSELYLSFRDFRIEDINFEKNIYSLIYLFLFKYNNDFINGFCKLFTKDTKIKFNDKEVSTNYYMNLCKRLKESFTQIYFDIKNIEMVDSNTAKVEYTFSGKYSLKKYFLDLNSYIIEPNDEIIETEPEIMNIKLNNNSNILELFINSNTENIGLESIYYKLLETQDTNNLITIQEYINNKKNLSTDISSR